MNASIKNPSLMLLALTIAILAVPGVAFAQQVDTPMGNVLVTVSGWFTSNTGKGLATIAVAIIGIYAMLGKMSWGTAGLAGAGVAVIFGAAAISYNLMCYGDATCVQNQHIADAEAIASQTPAVRAALLAAQQSAKNASQATADATATATNGATYTDGNAYDNQNQAAASTQAAAADNAITEGNKLVGDILTLTTAYNALISEGNTAAAQTVATQAQADMTQLQMADNNAADALGQANWSLYNTANNTTGLVQLGTLYSAANGAGEDVASSTLNILKGNYAGAEYGAASQGTGDGWANYYAAQAGNANASALFTTAYNDSGLALASITAAANNPGNVALQSSAISATITLDKANVAALNAVGDTNAADVATAAINAAMAAQNLLAAQQAMNSMNPSP